MEAEECKRLEEAQIQERQRQERQEEQEKQERNEYLSRGLINCDFVDIGKTLKITQISFKLLTFES